MKNNTQFNLESMYSLEAEAGVLGSIIIDPVCVAEILPKLPRADTFFKPEHRIIYDALLKLYIDNLPIDAISLRTELVKQHKLDEVGGVEYIAKILDSVPSSANAGYYARIVKEKEKERQVWTAVHEINSELEQPGDVNEKIQKIQSIALEIEPTNTGPDVVELKKEATNVAVDMRDNKSKVIATHFRDLDWLIHGYYPGEFAIIAGRPSMGKSALALDAALQMSGAGTPVFFSSLEMTPTSLIERAICNLARVDMTRLKSGEADNSEWEKVYEAGLKLRDRNITISKICYTPEQLAAMAHRLKQTHNIGIVFVDYIQLMTTSKRTESRQQEITEISRKLKLLSQKEDIPVVALSQLNRQVDSRENHRPRMSDLRESGSLEQDADIIHFIYRDDYYHKDEPSYETTGITEVITPKCRRGRVGTIKLLFLHDYTKFTNLAKDSTW